MNDFKEYSIDIGNQQLYCEYTDELNSLPTIVFDSGYGWTKENWDIIKNEIAYFSRVFIYDRAGLGKSEYTGEPRHSQRNVENLRRLLKEAEIKPPYILVGHSFGGVNVRLYTATYPEEIAGLVLLDSCHEDQNKLMVPLFSYETQEGYFSQFTVEGTLSEFEESLEQIRKYKSLGNIPLIVVTGGSQPHHTSESWTYWMLFQQDLAKLSTNSQHVILEKAGHAVHLDSPKEVIYQIKKMVDTFQQS
ncbi:alpha/beta hydrolase [Planococcus sp. S3-L1]|uniref:alpha/beta fold hydrolase n=1 Tax=Planococcus sp. S3-L1 TaxID=3046200 RepID=UPI0024B9C143|nr:alpha/beta hydrolase [Planococcus sp. S3-L1]MDJ0332683.1 alpha/beta hydrolase [Planococcus sp. S3-L1]